MMKYKVGDRVRIVSEPPEGLNWASEMNVYLGRVMTIKNVLIRGYKMVEDKGEWFWGNGMIAGLASETPFDFKAWKYKKVCMHCKTRQEAEAFCREMEKAGLTWRSGTSYLLRNHFGPYEEQTCYCFNEGTYDNTLHAKDEGYTILEWSEYRSTEPKEEQEKIMKTEIDNRPLSFKEAMEIKKKICESVIGACSNCSIANSADECIEFFTCYSGEAETFLKEWLAEHPTKTNRDKFVEVFGEIKRYGKCEYHCATVPCQSCDWWQQEYVEPYKEKE